MVASQLINQDARLRVMAARIIAQSKWPYLASILFSLKLVESSQISTLAVDDGWRMYFNPEFVLEHEAEALATMVLHEAMHCMLQHGPRFTALHQPNVLHPNWNISGDLGINSVLDDVRMPWGDFQPVRFSQFEEIRITPQMGTEQIFFKIMAYLKDNPDKAHWVSDCGSVSGGFARDYELPKNDSENGAIKQDQQDVLRDQVAQAVLDHLKKFPGSVPGAIARWADELLNPKVNWRKELAGSFRASLANINGRRDYFYTRPSRRQSAMRQGDSELILPSMRKPAPPAVAVVVDTSGSISTEEITEFLSEVDGIARANGVGHGIFIIPCDADVGPIQRLRSRGAIESLELPGGGGTDMGKGISAASNLIPVPKILIVLTDGITPWPDVISNKIEKAIVCLTSVQSRDEVPSWADVITIEKET